jgi:flagellin
MATGIPSLQRSLYRVNRALEKSFNRLSSGKKIVSSSDDPAGSAIAQQLAATVSLSGQARRNTGDALSASEIAGGAANQLSDIAGRLAELSAQSASGTISNDQRTVLDQEFQALSQESQRIVETSEFNGIKLLGGTDITTQAGIDGSSNSVISVPRLNGAEVASSFGSISIATQAGARIGLDTVSSVVKAISGEIGKQGAAQNRLKVASENLSTIELSNESSRAKIEDVDVASETLNLSLATTRRQIAAQLQSRYKAQRS